MNEQIFNKIIKEFNSFTNDLNNVINGNSYFKINNYKECYLIKEDWYNELSQIINDKNGRDNKMKQLLNKKPEIINNIKEVIKFLNSNLKFKLISSNVIKLGYEKKINLNSCNRVHYYAGNHKLIIEYMDKEENDTILLINPLEDINNQRTFIFRIKNKNPDKISFYKELININEINLEFFENNNNIIINCEEFGDKKARSSHSSLSIKNNNEKNNHLIGQFEKNILKILISIYYYEKSLKYNENIFKNNNRFYLMNPKWFNNFKDFYEYSNINKTLTSYHKNINFNNYEENINDIIDIFSNNNNLQLKQTELNEYLSNIDKIRVSQKLIENITYITNCYIVPFKIINMMNKIFFKNNHKLSICNIVLNKNKNLFVINGNTVNVGCINKELLFNAKNIFSFEDNKILDEEIKILYSTSIKNYIESKSCNILSYNSIQILKNEKFKNIGKLIIINNKIPEQNNNQQYNNMNYQNYDNKKSEGCNPFIQINFNKKINNYDSKNKRWNSVINEKNSLDYKRYITKDKKIKAGKNNSLDNNSLKNKMIINQKDNINVLNQYNINITNNNINRSSNESLIQFKNQKEEINRKETEGITIEEKEEKIKILIKEKNELIELMKGKDKEIEMIKNEKAEMEHKYNNEKKKIEKILIEKEKELKNKLDKQNILNKSNEDIKKKINDLEKIIEEKNKKKKTKK